MPRSHDHAEVFELAMERNNERFRAIEPGEVISFDRSEETATISPMVHDRPGVARQVIHRVPVQQPVAYSDVQAGMTGTILCCDRNPSRWWRNNRSSDPEGSATHVISNAIFVPGLMTKRTTRTIQSGAAVLEKPTVAGTVRLGDPSATKAAVHEDILNAIEDVFQALNAWATTAHADWATAATAFSSVTTLITAFSTGIAAGSYKSPSVKVED
jgi:hypothetical protein